MSVSTVTAPHGVAIPQDLYMWVKMCTSDDKTKKETCITSQRLLNSAGVAVITATVREVTGDAKSRMLMLSAPLGTQIEPGIKVAVDNGKVLSLKYALCFVDGCYAQTPVDDAFVKALKSGKKLNVTLVNVQGKAVSTPLTLTGFTQVYSDKGLDPAAAKLRFDLLTAAVKAKGSEATPVSAKATTTEKAN